MTSSPHGPYELGYTRATKVKSMRGNNVSWSKSLKFIKVRIEGCNSPS
jgi:hypothetical protein